MSTKAVYFDIPSRHSTAYIAVDVSRDIDALTREVSRMMGATAIRINCKEYKAKNAEYKKEYGNVK